jgi:tetratricopeptide (TPR) repeat protein
MIAKAALFLIMVMVSCPLLVLGQQTEDELYAAGLKFESQANWQQAADTFEKLVKANPNRHEVWLRMSDIYAKLGKIDQTLVSLRRVVSIKGDNPVYFQKLSQAYSVNQDPKAALRAIELAVALAPNNRSYLYSKAELAGWAKDNESALQAYSALIKLDPTDSKALLGRARVYTWIGKVDKSAVDYKNYLSMKPNDNEALFEYARVELWRGDFHDTLIHLEKYKANNGDLKKYDELKARTLAWTTKLDEARDIVETQLPNEPNNFDANVTNTLVLANNNEPKEAIDSLLILDRLKPDDLETRNIRRFVLTPVRSNLAPRFRYYQDSDGIKIYTPRADFQYFINPETKIIGGAELNFLKARSNSGFENINGSRTITHQKIWLGIGHRFSPRLAVDVSVGGARAQGVNSTFAFDAKLFARPTDRVRLTFYGNRDFYIVSPRSVSLGVKRTLGGMRLNWVPGSRTFVDADFSYGRFSDGNNKFELDIAPRRAVLRRENFNLDLGVRASIYGYSKDLNNGYYDPNWKINENNNVNFVFMYGAQRDTFTQKFKFATNGSVEGKFGIYDNVMFRVAFSGLNNSRANSGAFRGFSFETGLIFRF